MNLYQKFKTATFVCFAFTCIFFCLIFLIPLVVERQAISEISNQNTMRSDNYLDWGSFPGSYNVKIEKTFTLFNIENVSDSENKIYITNNDKILYDYNLSYANAEFVPNTNGQIKALKQFQHINVTNEESIKNHTITQPNFGIYKAFDREINFLDFQYITFELFRMISSMKTNFASNYFAHAIFHYYISNQTLTNHTIFLKNNLLTLQQADSIWGDVTYGWSNINGLKSWIDIIISNEFSSHANWNFFKLKFALSETEIQMLVGQNSKLNELFTAVQGLINDQFQTICFGECTPQILFESQWSAQISQTQLLPEIPPFESYKSLNNTLSCTPEISLIINSTTMFMNNDFETLLAYDGEGEINSDLKSLFNFENVKFILQNEASIDNIKTYFELSTDDQALALVKYLQFIQTNCLSRKISSNLSTSISDSEKEIIGLANLMNDVLLEPLQQITDFILVNLTNKALVNKKISCSNVFDDPILNNKTEICLMSQLNMSSLESNLPWVSAYYGQNTSPAWQNMIDLTNLTEGQLEYLFSASLYGKTLILLQNSLVKQYKCSTSPCLAEELALMQWGNSTITTYLPTDFFSNSDITFSISSWNPTIFVGKIPEFYAYSANSENPFSINETFSKKLLSFSVGGLYEYHERQEFIREYLEKDSQNLNDRFSLSISQAKVLYDYLRYVVVQYLFDGVFLTKTPYEFLWGYENKYIKNLKTKPSLMGGDSHTSKISLKLRDNENDFMKMDPSCFIQLDTGLQDETNSRKVMKFNGNNTILQRKMYYNGANLIYYFTNPWDNNVKLQGTDGFGFKPYVDKDEDLYMFEDEFYRSIKLLSRGKTSCNQYECQKYQIDETQFGISKNYNIDTYGIINLTTVAGGPLEITNPYFIQADKAAYDMIMVNNQSIENYQKDAILSYFLIEPQTGVTTKMFKNYQYNVHLKENILISGDFIGKDYHYPVLLETLNMEFNDDRANYQFDVIMHQMKLASIFRSVSVGLSVLFFICFLVACTKYVKERKNRTNRSSSEPFLKNEQTV